MTSIWILILGLFLVLNGHTEAFWWGISTAPYQTEDPAVKGGDPNFFKTDWDLFYDAGKLKEAKGDGVFSYTEYKRDIQKLKELGMTHYRFGIEWARIEPTMGKYNLEALAHYKKIILELKKNGITPIICLWHWSFPSWGFDVKDGSTFGWLNDNVKKRWPDFVTLVVKEFKDEIFYYAPQNEPNAQSLAGFFLGTFPPGEKYSLRLFRNHVDRAADAFIVAAKIIRTISPNAKIMSVQNMINWEKAWWDFASYFYDIGQEFNYHHLDRIKDYIDILGFNYYYRVKASPIPNPRIIDPEGLGTIMLALTEKYKKPLLLTENGWADDKGDVKKDYFLKHVAVAKKMRDQVGLMGYFYWSLIDNYEWASGYKEKFGMYKMNPKDRSLVPYDMVDVVKKTIADDATKK
tara:strand:- start:23967 stop:25181 length:1215 start_codon:yes stop_codon:yes gene_type:complete